MGTSNSVSMMDLRNQLIEVGQEVFYIHVGKGTFSRLQGIVVGFTKTMVRILLPRPNYRGEEQFTLKQPEYIIIK